MSNKRLPAEWEPQQALLLTWPHEGGAWGQDIQNIERVFFNITCAVAKTQTVIIGVKDAAHQQHILAALKKMDVLPEKVKTYFAPSNDVWARDHGPITVLQEKLDGLESLDVLGDLGVLCDFRFTGWGGKYPHQLDDLIPELLAQSGLLSGYAYQKFPFILEGGAIDCDGEGTLLTTEKCLRSSERHANLTREQIEHHLAQTLGIKRVLWLSDGHLSGDDTDGHIDTLARFLNPTTIAYVTTDDQNSPDFQSLKAMEQTLLSFKNNRGDPYNLVKLPLPEPIFDKEGNRLPATYANFLLCNGQVLVPLYRDPKDPSILETFRHHFPNRIVTGIDCNSAIEQYGSLHCLTMQIPAIIKR
jgi:agmatine deiminase